ncbi:hypothetical protein M501DRAFT_985834 [Patellaria atrata CBS 101060]|uniref:Uncharacterized protein n=1 Tax=Patellaria atrata CBS 101060 TaxID=1346257 RepID=A0A9P4SKW3_9PEZI|nr:hypothetical protein M501DRAFT_985834 [Patellaria atrata CBS 101060]
MKIPVLITLTSLLVATNGAAILPRKAPPKFMSFSFRTYKDNNYHVGHMRTEYVSKENFCYLIGDNKGKVSSIKFDNQFKGSCVFYKQRECKGDQSLKLLGSVPDLSEGDWSFWNDAIMSFKCFAGK